MRIGVLKLDPTVLLLYIWAFGLGVRITFIFFRKLTATEGSVTRVAAAAGEKKP